MSSTLENNVHQNPAERRVHTVRLLGTYQPRQCGIATFTQDLRNAIASELGEWNTRVVAVDDIPESYAYGPEVELNLPQQSRSDYRAAADLLNLNQIDIVSIQHEFGIYGGDDGRFLLDLMSRLHMPIISTLHTVLEQPSSGQRHVMDEIIEQSSRLVVMSERARSILIQTYDVPEKKIVLIPHGIHDQPFTDPHFHAERFKLEGKRVLLTFGLMGPGKGLETVIRALPAIVEKHPDAIYLIVGATHPHVKRQEGSRYRQSLEALANELGVSEHVRFHEHFVSIEELAAYLGVAWVYIVPYPRADQVTSGTLAYALGAGKAVVSTPFWHAQELLADGRGCLFPFNNARALSEHVIRLLTDDEERNAIRRKAYQHGRAMVWSQVGKAYVELANQVLRERISGEELASQISLSPADLSLESEPMLDHVLRLTDDTGMLQHARFAIPDRKHGYCTDDNARALIAVTDHYNATEDPRSLALMDRYLGFVAHAFNESVGRFRNFMNYNRTWCEESGSDDSHGRAVWALGHFVRFAPQDGQRQLAHYLFKQASDCLAGMQSPRSWAFGVLGHVRFLSKIPIDTTIYRQLGELANRISIWLDSAFSEAWLWPEESLSYDNARIPQAMIEAGLFLNQTALVDRGISILKWLIDLQIRPGGPVSVIGNRGWGTRAGFRARFDQQPLELNSIISACESAYHATNDARWFDHAKEFYLWFIGGNDLALSMRDTITGGCLDGLHWSGLNYNQGAESTLAYFASTLAIKRLYSDAIRTQTHLERQNQLTTTLKVESA